MMTLKSGAACFLAFLFITNVSAETLSQLFPGDINIASNPKVLLHEDFENGWGKWRYPSANTRYLFLEKADGSAHGGHGFLRSTVTSTDLSIDPYITSGTRFVFNKPVDSVYWRFYTRFTPDTPTPHHWVKLAATNGLFDARGKAGVKPDGDEAAWLFLDINNNDLFSFYVYWHEMRSGRCNDGSSREGCEGDQGSTYYYGNRFKPAAQTPIKRDEWVCIEIHAKLNDPGKSNGELSLWMNDALVGHYAPGTPGGTWLRDHFISDKCEFLACTEAEPFAGFNFRTSDNVKFREIYLSAYYQRNTFQRKKTMLKEAGKNISDNQTIYYDDIVVATERIGCTSAIEK